MKNILNIFKILFWPQGRLDKRTFTIIFWVFIVLFFLLYIHVGHDKNFKINVDNIGKREWILVDMLIYSYYVIFIKRSHDLGSSFWKFIIRFNDLFNKEGDKGPNKYGPNPLEKLTAKK